MGLETAPQNPLGRIDPSSLIGRPEAVVTPQAVEALSNAVRQGFITAEDIRARVKQNPATEAKQKAEIQLASEFTSPEAVARRKQEAELKEAQLTFGTNLQAFQALAPEAGIAQPMTEDGRPDYAKMAELGAKLAARKAKKQIALEHLTAVGAPLTAHQNGQAISFHTNKFGEVIDDDLKARYANDMSPFSDLAPGQAQSAPAAPVSGGVVSPISSGTVPPELQIMPKNQTEAIQRDAEIQKFLPSQVQSKQAAKPMVTPTPVGKSIPGGGINLGTKESAVDLKATIEKEQQLINIRDTLGKLQAAKTLVASDSTDVVGPVAGTIGRVTAFVGSAFGNDKATDMRNRQTKLRFLVNQLTMELTSRLKGPLSEKELAFLRASVPDLKDDNAAWEDFLTQFEVTLKDTQAALGGAAPTASATPQNRVAPFSPVTLSQRTPQNGWGEVKQHPAYGAIQRGPDGTYYAPATQ